MGWPGLTAAFLDWYLCCLFYGIFPIPQYHPTTCFGSLSKKQPFKRDSAAFLQAGTGVEKHGKGAAASEIPIMARGKDTEPQKPE